LQNCHLVTSTTCSATGRVLAYLLEFAEGIPWGAVAQDVEGLGFALVEIAQAQFEHV